MNAILRASDLLLLTVALIWGTSYGVAKQALDYYPVLGFLAVRFCLTSLILLPQLRGAGIKAWSRGVPLGGVLLLIFLCETYGVMLTTASNAAFLISLCLIFTPLLEWGLTRRRPSLRIWLAVGLSLAGAGLLGGGLSLTFNRGDGLMLLAALLRALLVCLTARLGGAREVPMLAMTAVQTGVVGAACLLLGLALPGGLPGLPTEPAFWGASLYLVLFATLLALLIQNQALRSSSPTRVALLMGSEPLFGALFAAFWLDERLDALAWLGGCLIVVATLWASLERRSAVQQ